MRWWMTRRVERRATRMQEMMDRLDVDGRALVRAEQGHLYAEARNQCLSCGASDQCLRWLDGDASVQDRPPGFCPNHQLFQRFLKHPVS
jgi:hypothetical protein